MTEETYRKWLEQLWANHGDQVFAYAARRVGTAHAEDVVADVFVVAWRHGRDVRGGSSHGSMGWRARC